MLSPIDLADQWRERAEHEREPSNGASVGPLGHRGADSLILNRE